MRSLTTTDRDTERTPLAERPASVLLVEDDDRLRSVFLRALQKMGVDPVWTAASSEEARSIIGVRLPMMVLADWNLPGDSGIDLVRWLRRTERSSHRCVPIVLMSGSITNRERNEALDAGAAAVLEKPFRLSELQGIIKRLTADAR